MLIDILAPFNIQVPFSNHLAIFKSTPMTLDSAAESTDESQHWPVQTSRIVAYFSIVTKDEVKKLNSPEKSVQICSKVGNDGAAPRNHNSAVSKDTDNLVTVIKTVLDDCTRALQNVLRQKRRKEIANVAKATALKATNDEVDNDNDEQPRNSLKVPDYASLIEVEAPSSMYVDLTSIALLSSLVSPDISESRGEWQCDCPKQENDCPLQSLAAAKPEWWDRPLWAWNWRELILAHATIVAQSIVETLSSGEETWNAVISTDKSLAQLVSSLYCRDSRCQLPHLPILIESVADGLVIDRVLKESVANEDPRVARMSQQTLESNRRCEETLVTKECRDETNDKAESSQEKSKQNESPIMEETEAEMVCTPETVKRVEPKQLDTESVAKVTPEPDRGTKSSAFESKSKVLEARNGCKTEISRPKLPQFDSSGIDVTMLSQLPPSVRSEARIAMALSESASISRRKQKPVARGSLAKFFSRQSKDMAKASQSTTPKWLTAADVDEETLRELPQDIQQMIQKELSSSRETQSNRKRTGIASFFPSTGKRLK